MASMKVTSSLVATIDHRSYELFMVSSWKVGPSYGTHKEHLPQMRPRIRGKYHTTGVCPGQCRPLEFDSESYFISIL